MAVLCDFKSPGNNITSMKTGESKNYAHSSVKDVPFRYGTQNTFYSGNTFHPKIPSATITTNTIQHFDNNSIPGFMQQPTYLGNFQQHLIRQGNMMNSGQISHPLPTVEGIRNTAVSRNTSVNLVHSMQGYRNTRMPLANISSQTNVQYNYASTKSKSSSTVTLPSRVNAAYSDSQQPGNIRIYSKD